MSWVAVDKNGDENIYRNKPIKYDYHQYSGQWNDLYYPCYDITIDKDCEVDSKISLPKGSIKKLIGKELTFEDEPVELV